jgi:hypothetical protein
MQKYLKLLATALVLLACIQLLPSCKKEFDKVKKQWNPTMAVPVIDTELDVYRIFAARDSSDLVVRDPLTGSISLIYKGNLESPMASEMIKLPIDPVFETELKLTASESNTLSGSGSFQKNQNFVFDYAAEVEIDSIKLKTGVLSIRLVNSFQFTGRVTIKMPGIVKNGTPLEFSQALSGQPFDITKEIGIAGYTVQMSTGPSVNNKIPIEMSLQLNYDGNASSLNKSIVVSVAMQNWNFERLHGYLGNMNFISQMDSTLIKIFANATDGYFELTNPFIRMEFDNSFGIPVGINISSLYSLNLNTNATTNILLSSFQNPFTIAAPALSQLGSTQKTIVYLDKNNSNMKSLLNSAPKYFVYGFSANANPTAPQPGMRNFLTDSSRLKINTEVELPLEGFAYGFTITDTLDFEMPIEDSDEINWVVFRMAFDNGFPVNVKMQTVFLDENRRPIDSLLNINENLISAGIAGSDGRVTSPSREIKEITVDKDRFRKLQRAKYVVIRGGANSLNASGSNPNNPVVKIYSDYKLGVKLGLRVNSKPGQYL